MGEAAGEWPPLTDWQREFIAKAAEVGVTMQAPRQNLLQAWRPKRDRTADDWAAMLGRARNVQLQAQIELDDANALLLDLAGQLWDAEKELDALRERATRTERAEAHSAKVMECIEAARKVLYATYPYPNSPSNRTWHWDRLATKITERIDWFEGEIAKWDARLQTAYDYHNVDRNQFADEIARVTAERDKWKRIAAELAADHLGGGA